MFIEIMLTLCNKSSMLFSKVAQMKENNEWLYYRPTGEHILSETEDGQILYTFLPHPLTEVKIKVDDELSNLLCTANRFLGRLDGMSDFLPNVFAVEYILMHKEQFYGVLHDYENPIAKKQ